MSLQYKEPFDRYDSLRGRSEADAALLDALNLSNNIGDVKVWQSSCVSAVEYDGEQLTAHLGSLCLYPRGSSSHASDNHYILTALAKCH